MQNFLLFEQHLTKTTVHSCLRKLYICELLMKAGKAQKVLMKSHILGFAVFL